MKRFFASMLLALRRRRAASAYAHYSRRTTELYLERRALGDDLRAALQAEAAAAARMERLFAGEANT